MSTDSPPVAAAHDVGVPSPPDAPPPWTFGNPSERHVKFALIRLCDLAMEAYQRDDYAGGAVLARYAGYGLRGWGVLADRTFRAALRDGGLDAAAIDAEVLTVRRSAGEKV